MLSCSCSIEHQLPLRAAALGGFRDDSSPCRTGAALVRAGRKVGEGRHDRRYGSGLYPAGARARRDTWCRFAKELPASGDSRYRRYGDSVPPAAAQNAARTMVARHPRWVSRSRRCPSPHGPHGLSRHLRRPLRTPPDDVQRAAPSIMETPGAQALPDAPRTVRRLTLSSLP